MYKSPINILYGEFEMQMEKQIESDVVRAVQKYDVDVNKEELIRALNYDRGQYDKGFEDGFNASKWIPCNFEMPYFNDGDDEDKEYLVTTSYGSVYTCDYGYAHDSDTIPRFHRWEGEYECYIPDVIAWMELPKPYKPIGE